MGKDLQKTRRVARTVNACCLFLENFDLSYLVSKHFAPYYVDLLRESFDCSSISMTLMEYIL